MSAIVNSQNSIFANGGGECPISASFAVGGIDNSKVTEMTFQVVRPSQTVTGNTVAVRNELGGTGEFALIPYAQDAGLVYYRSGHFDVVSLPPDPTCSAYYMTSGFPSVNLTTPVSLRSLLITTPYVYDGSEYYTATVDGRNIVMGSGAYCNLAKAQKENGSIDWVICGSGWYEL